ncbi:MAG: TatD family hydrolase, partial [Chloroflexota bacterium]
EIGLDYSSTDQSERKVQREVFSQIIQHCFDISNKVLTIHSRRSAVDVISIVGNSFPGKIIMHWFTGTQSQAERAVLNGYYFSFNSSMLNSRNGQLLAKIIPREKILTETDGPFITIDDEPVRPGYIPQTVSKMAELLNVEKDELQKKIFENFQTLVAIENGYAE